MKISPDFNSLLKARKNSDKDMIMAIPDVTISNIFSFDDKEIFFNCDEKLNVSWKLNLPARITEDYQIDEVRVLINKINDLIDLYYQFVEDIAELVK